MSLKRINLEELADRCAAETRKFKRREKHDERFCLEIFRRAIVERCHKAWEKVLAQYLPQVRHWVCRCTSAFRESELEEVAADALTRFWEKYTPQKFSRGKGLRSVLTYLRACAVSETHERQRQFQKRALEMAWDDLWLPTPDTAHPSAEEVILEDCQTEQIWARVREQCHNEQEIVIVRAMFVAGLKPSQVQTEHAELFPAVQDVYRIKRNLLDRLRRDDKLNKLL